VTDGDCPAEQVCRQGECVADAPKCGNGELDPGEDCDLAIQPGDDCLSEGFDGGELACDPGSCTYDTSGCTLSTCGDGVIDAGEDCDGFDLKGASCQSLGYGCGTLSCSGCLLDKSRCLSSPCCGDGVVDAGEECDGDQLGDESCESRGFTGGGTLGCTPDCFFDLSGCLCAAQPVVEPPFDEHYSARCLGPVQGLPTPYGGLTVHRDDPDRLLIGGAANYGDGAVYSVGLRRDADHHIVALTGQAEFFASAPNIDGGLAYDDDGVLFFTTYSQNELGQILPGSSSTDRLVALGPLGVASSVGAMYFVPDGFPGAGQLKAVSWSGGQWYTLNLSLEMAGTYNVVSATWATTIEGGPEGFIYVSPGSPIFEDQFGDYNCLLVAEYSASRISAYSLDQNGDPEPSSRVDVANGFSQIEGAYFDPLSGDFIFSTWAGGVSAVYVIEGLAPMN
jgi:hypothetical protein